MTTAWEPHCSTFCQTKSLYPGEKRDAHRQRHTREKGIKLKSETFQGFVWYSVVVDVSVSHTTRVPKLYSQKHHVTNPYYQMIWHGSLEGLFWSICDVTTKKKKKDYCVGESLLCFCWAEYAGRVLYVHIYSSYLCSVDGNNSENTSTPHNHDLYPATQPQSNRCHLNCSRSSNWQATEKQLIFMKALISLRGLDEHDSTSLLPFGCILFVFPLAESRVNFSRTASSYKDTVYRQSI